jgi:hypothetical protein
MDVKNIDASLNTQYGRVGIINVKMFLHYDSYFPINYYASFLCKDVDSYIR